MGPLFAELVEAAPDALFALSLTGVVLSWNRGAEATFGYTASEAIGTSLEQLIIPDDHRVDSQRYLAAAVAGRVTTFEATRRHKSGSLLDVRGSMRRVTPADGEPYVAVSKQDVTQLRQFERRQLEERTGRLGSKLLANMSHELRTPLNAIIGFVELMHSGKAGPLSPDHHEYLGDVLTSSRHLLQLINDVMDLAKVESGKPSGSDDAG